MLFIMLVCSLISTPDGVIYSGTDVVTAEEMIDVLSEVDVVFIGEMHNDSLAHQWELFIWQALGSEDRALALEMFETDVQPLLDAYLADEISEEEFLSGSRPWDNYESDYAPMVEYARSAGLRVIAANVPRTYAGMVALGGFESILEEPGFGDISLDSSNTFYKTRFQVSMDAFGDQMHGMPVSFENIYRAQLLKDVVMANSIAGERVIFVCGSFHSDFHSGIPDQMSTDSFLTVSVLSSDENFNPELADFVISQEEQFIGE